MLAAVHVALVFAQLLARERRIHRTILLDQRARDAAAGLRQVNDERAVRELRFAGRRLGRRRRARAVESLAFLGCGLRDAVRPDRARALGAERLLHPLHLDAGVLEVLGERGGAHRVVAHVQRVGARRVRARRARGARERRHVLQPLLAELDRRLDRGERRGEVPRHAVQHGDDRLVVSPEGQVAAAVGLVRHADRALERGPDVPVLDGVEVEHVADVVLPAVAVERRRVASAEAVHPLLVVGEAERVVRRVGRGREEERRHLAVVVHEHLRPPAADLARHLPRLRLAHGERVAVGIELVVRAPAADAPGLRALLLERPVLGVPLAVRVDPGDEALVAVGVVRRVDQHDRVLQERVRERVVARHELVGHLHHGLERRRLVAVDAVVEPHRDRQLARQLVDLALRDAARVGELLVAGADRVQLRQVLGRGDDEQRALARLHRAAERLALHALGPRALDGVQHAFHVAPRGVERARLVAQNVRRLRHARVVRPARVEIELLRRGRGGGGGEGHEPGAGERAEENRQQTCAAHADASGRGDGKAFREGRGVYASAAGRAAGG